MNKITGADLFFQYMAGWSCAAACKAIPPEREQHSNEAMRKAFSDGWQDGKDARMNAARYATDTYGYVPSIIRAQ